MGDVVEFDTKRMIVRDKKEASFMALPIEYKELCLELFNTPANNNAKRLSINVKIASLIKRFSEVANDSSK